MKKITPIITAILPSVIFVALIGALLSAIASPNEIAVADLIAIALLMLLKSKQYLPKIATVIFYVGINLLTALLVNVGLSYLAYVITND